MTPTIEEVAGWLREAATECEDFRGWLESDGHTALATDKEDQGILFRNRAAQVEAMGWRPIEEAPKDKSMADLWEADSRVRIPDCTWLCNAWHQYRYEDGWVEVTCGTITHFMFPPAPPVKR